MPRLFEEWIKTTRDASRSVQSEIAGVGVVRRVGTNGRIGSGSWLRSGSQGRSRCRKWVGRLWGVTVGDGVDVGGEVGKPTGRAVGTGETVGAEAKNPLDKSGTTAILC